MLKDHPRGLFVAFFANMGERFGFYTMIAIFVLFLQAKYGYTPGQASQVYGIFLFFVYFLPLLGGFLADKVLGYGKTIGIGMVVMFVGYLMLAIPTKMNAGFALVVGALAVISLGTGLFKGNLQALVGNLYDDPKYSKKRDIAFNIFYMGINIGAMFAPTTAEAVSNWVLAKFNFVYDARIPALAHKFVDGELTDASKYLDIAQMQDPSVSLSSLGQFSTDYIDALSRSYHFGFGVACISLIASMLIFWGFRKYYKSADFTEKQKAANADMKDQMITLTPKQTKDRLTALGLVFFVVIFFWMAFHQNGLTLTFFARDYTQSTVGKATNLFFDLFGLLPIFLSVIGLVFLFRKQSKGKTRLIGGIAFVVFAVLAYLRYTTYADVNPFSPQKFQHFNPFFIVALTPIIVAIFSYLNRVNREPSAPKKIGIGMLITSLAFVIMLIGSLSLMGYSPSEIGGTVAPVDKLVSPYWLISTYFTLTVAELFLSPMGISFVSKVSPPKYKGLMQGGWLAATAIGNYLIVVPGSLWDIIPLWGVWAVLVVLCILSAIFIFSILKRLERTTSS
ncbi:MAG: peptide MFS transporter [Bacteroidales bacterium]|nr:peptide MFS transporter [Bacteroidales bacterium]MCF8387114.1 peptide MFS transporter [Bacteroidales bacterium]MCF8398016.1 peptide MFS transporter [Bacteroidales bacterium]